MNRFACSYQLQASSTVNSVEVTPVFAILLCCCKEYLMTGISGDDGNTD